MNKKYFITILIIVTFGVVGLLVGSKNRSKPQSILVQDSETHSANAGVNISPATQDLGIVIYGDVATTEFTLTNSTPKTLNITRVSTSCGCTSAEVERKTIKPYESTTVSVSFDPAVHKDDTDLGELTRTIYIDTDNPNFPKVTSTITANVIKK